MAVFVSLRPPLQSGKIRKQGKLRKVMDCKWEAERIQDQPGKQQQFGCRGSYSGRDLSDVDMDGPGHSWTASSTCLSPNGFRKTWDLRLREEGKT